MKKGDKKLSGRISKGTDKPKEKTKAERRAEVNKLYNNGSISEKTRDRILSNL